MAAKEFFGTPSLLKRLLALALDLIVVNLIIARPFSGLISSIIGGEKGVAETIKLLENNQAVINDIYVVLFFISAIALLYFAVMEWKFGQTIGQMMMGLRIEAVKGDIGFWQCAMNNLFILPFFPFIMLWVVDPLFMFYSGGQRLSEKIAGVKMVQKYSIQKRL